MKTTLYMAMTVNGYIAKEDGSAPWSDTIWDSYYTIAKQFPCLILGRKTYDIMKEVGEFEKIGNPFTVVLTHTDQPAEEGFAFVNSPAEALEILQEKGFDRVMVGGGGMANTSFMKEGLIDEIILDVEPMIFGKGITLFEDEDFEAHLELIETKKLSDSTIRLQYSVKK